MNRKITDNPNVKEQTLQVLMKEDNQKDNKSMKMLNLVYHQGNANAYTV